MKTLIITLMLFCVIIMTCRAATRYWIGGGTASFTDGTKWSLTSNGPPIGGTITWINTDIARFDTYSGSPIVTFPNTHEDIGKLQISGSITVTFKPISDGNKTLDINAVATDAFTVASGSTLVISGLDAATDRDMHVDLHSTGGVTANIYGTVKVTDDATGYGEFYKGLNATANFNAGSTYQHHSNSTSSDIPIASWNSASTCSITGVVDNKPGNLIQSFGNLTWNNTSQNTLIDITDGSNNAPYVQGSFTLTSTGSSGIRISISDDASMTVQGNYVQNGGNFYPSTGSANDIIYLGGNFSFSSGNLSCPGTGSCKFLFNTAGVHTYSKTGGFYGNKIHFEVPNTSILDMGSFIIDGASTGNFTLNSGGGLKTAHSQGIAASGAYGCIQLTGTRTYHANASYTFYGSDAQSTGNGFSSAPTNVITIGSTTNATTLTFTNSPVTISNKLVLVSNATTNSSIAPASAVNYGSSGTLEYQGLFAQTTTSKEWPISNPPSNITINNASGVNLHENRTVSSAFTLTSGAFAIGNHVLTLNGTLSKTAGALTGGSTSDIVVGGTSGSPLDIPAVVLDDLTINRNGGMRLIGNITVQDSLNMTNGSVSLNGYTLAYGATGMLLYNGTALQITANGEFPASSGPFHLVIANSSGVNLHASRTIGGNLILSSGVFSIGSNTLTLSGNMIVTSGSLYGGTSSSLTIAGTAAAFSIPGLTLNNLTLNRSAGASMIGNLTIHGTMNLLSGNLSIGAHLLTMNGTISYTSSLLGGSTSELNVGTHVSALILDTDTLKNLTISRTAGVDLTGDIIVNENLTLHAGQIRTHGFQLYGPSATLIYNGSSPQTTSDDEWPSANGPQNISVNNGSGVILNANRTVENTFTLTNGTFSIGANTLTLKGAVIKSPSGGLSGGSFSNLKFEGTGLSTGLPSVTLSDLTIDRSSGIVMAGDVTVHDSLFLLNGYFQIGDYMLTLNGPPVAGTPVNLKSSLESKLILGGTSSNVSVPPGIGNLKILTVQNPSPVSLTGNLYISLLGAFNLGGVMNCLDKEISGTGDFIMNPNARLLSGHPLGVSGNIALTGSILIDSETEWEFNGTVNQVTGFLPTSIPNTIRNLIINNTAGSTVTLNQSMTLLEDLEIMSGSSFTVDSTAVLEINGNTVIHQP